MNHSNQQGKKWIEQFARFGIFSKGVVYCLIGVLTALAAFGLGGEKANKNEAFRVIYDQPFGKILLFIIAIGLLGYVVWRFLQAVFDLDYKGNDTKAKLTRLGYGLSAIIYLGLAIYALRLALSGGRNSNGDSQQFIVNKILSYPAGEWIIGVAALLIVANGVRQIYNAVSGRFMKDVQLMRARYADVFRKTGVAGYISRGVVLMIIGYFFFRAAIYSNANEAQGTDAAFSFLENNFGSVLMGITAAGLAGYGVFMFVKGKYQRIDLHF
jgi:hypothetical protein